MMRFFVPALMAVFFLFAGCTGDGNSPASESQDLEMMPPIEAAPTAERTYTAGRFTPPAGQTLLIMGQDMDSIDSCVAAVDDVPGGVTNYTSVQQLEGIHKTADYGSGPHNLDTLAQTYPDSSIAAGLSLVNFLPQTAAGKADDNIDKLLDALQSYERPVYLRIGYEFDGPWNHYDPDQYVSAWRRIHKRMTEKGINNVALVWQSSTYCGETFGGHPVEAWYPGDEVVDWVGLSYFVQEADCDLQPLEEMVAFARKRNKPLMIAEATPQRYKTGELTFSYDGSELLPKTAEEIWNEWYAPFLQFIHDNEDIIRAVAYINANWDDQPMWSVPYRNGYWGDSRVQSNKEIKER